MSECAHCAAAGQDERGIVGTHHRGVKPDRLSQEAGEGRKDIGKGGPSATEIQDGQVCELVGWGWPTGLAAGPEAMQTEAMFDGSYVVYTDLPAERMSKEESVASCRKLNLIEYAFRNLKTVWLQVRPVYHKTDDLILAHVFICMLAYYLQWHKQRWLVSLFASDGRGKNLKWSFSLVMESLRQISFNPVRMGKVQFEQLTVPTADQQRILDLLGLKL